MKGAMVKKLQVRLALMGLALAPGLAFGFNSGSTGADGAFSPTVNTVLALPASGVFNFTTVNIPSGVTVSFKKNATNTPVVILASGNVTIAGYLGIAGSDGAPSGSGGDGTLGDDGLPGAGGPGGYNGGRGGVGNKVVGGFGLGPGGGAGGTFYSGWANPYWGGGGGSFGTVGAYSYTTNAYYSYGNSASGPTYGTSQLLPLIGGSGGGGGVGGSVFSGGGGGGGGGALLIASSGTVNITGTINANGGIGAVSSGAGCGGGGGGGSGGAIRVVATAIQGNGTVGSSGGTGSVACAGGAGFEQGGAGGQGRIRFESESITRTAATTPAYTFGAPGSVFVAGLPTLLITSVGGAAVPAEPTGNADVTLPSTTANPVLVTFATTGVPVGNTVQLTLKPASGTPVTVVSPALTGTTESGTASVSVSLPSGPSVLQATVTYTIVVAMGEALSTYAQGERVEKITLAATLGGKESKVILVTVSGKEYEVPSAVLAAMPS